MAEPLIVGKDHAAGGSREVMRSDPRRTVSAIFGSDK